MRWRWTKYCWIECESRFVDLNEDVKSTSDVQFSPMRETELCTTTSICADEIEMNIWKLKDHPRAGQRLRGCITVQWRAFHFPYCTYVRTVHHLHAYSCLCCNLHLLQLKADLRIQNSIFFHIKQIQQYFSHP
jgi:hypothetical protein